MAQIKVNVAYGATGTLATANIADDAITSAKLADDSVVAAAIADNAVVTAAINADAVTDAKIADDVIGTEHFTAGEVDATALGADSVTAAKIGDNVLDSEHYAAASIDNEHLADNAADTAEIADNAITLAKMAGGTDGNIISYDANGDPVAIATGSDGQVLTSTGAGSPPAFEAVAAGAQFKLVQTTTNSATTGSVAITGAGFTPKFIYLWYDVGSWVAGRVGMGMAMGTGTYDQFSFNDGNQQTSDSYKFTAGKVQDHIYSSSNYSYLALASLDADGCTLTKTKYGSPSGTVTLEIAFFA